MSQAVYLALKTSCMEDCQSFLPLEAPVFCPTFEEFEDPLLYLEKIYSFASAYGICKIRPPKGWRPPFAIDENKFLFNPRIQNLTEISAYNRVKNEFITSLVNFWELQVSSRLGKSVDLFTLWQTVGHYGGNERVTSGKHWGDVCKKLNFDATPAIASSDMVSCRKCGKNDRTDLLICDGCDYVGAYHMACLDPLLSYVPKGKWFCPTCFVNNFKSINKIDEFGFRKSANSYSLQSFGVYADDFKSKYFGKPSHVEVESEFWRLISDAECDVSVEYGADLNVSVCGSGFPISPTSRYNIKQYANSPWNLNNFAMNERSALRYLPTDISGMKVPWCYVGMVFSCFCWHTEDHWSFSINYLHRGEPKTWYGVPSASADAFEVAIRQEVPELFEHSPDLLHHMTTMLPPSRLFARGVPVFKLNQMAGEFVVTFPRAYHSGFNHGFNFAEAVNFCPASWFPFGRNSIDQYALIHRPPVFSHAELLCRMAESVDNLSIDFLVVVTDQLADLLEKERSLRRHLARLGVRRTERFVFETCEEELRECMLCKTTLFTSALTCDCSKSNSLTLAFFRLALWRSPIRLPYFCSSFLASLCCGEIIRINETYEQKLADFFY
ncbi:unnamed protein product [Schistocephalus solidus]|uniref:[histone H3]-trimethyl-L-lysine(4) demethylase n=1 Tax=Schistocephalus solidus TaxID=70667 RepID=A0A3P7DJ58_SCHSO|nr:unnamed protein product [Schistocephalus solidus]